MTSPKQQVEALLKEISNRAVRASYLANENDATNPDWDFGKTEAFNECFALIKEHCAELLK